MAVVVILAVAKDAYQFRLQHLVLALCHVQFLAQNLVALSFHRLAHVLCHVRLHARCLAHAQSFPLLVHVMTTAAINEIAF